MTTIDCKSYEWSEDWQWFGEHPGRSYRARLATSAELALHEWLDAAQVPPSCFIYAISRVIRDDPPLELQTLFVVLEPRAEMGEAGCWQAWLNAEGRMGGKVRRQGK